MILRNSRLQNKQYLQKPGLLKTSKSARIAPLSQKGSLTLPQSSLLMLGTRRRHVAGNSKKSAIFVATALLSGLKRPNSMAFEQKESSRVEDMMNASSG